MSSTRRIHAPKQLKHVAPNRKSAIETGALYYRQPTPCAHCDGTIRGLANGKCVCRPVRTRRMVGR